MLKIEDAPEASDIVRAFDLEAPEAEIRKLHSKRYRVLGCVRLWQHWKPVRCPSQRGATNIITAQVNKPPKIHAKSAIAGAARALMRRAFKGTLASIDARNDYPYASLITLATDVSGAPTFFISKLARHTANLARDARASILVDETSALSDPDPLQG
jgi:Pyridoxamine 5'-phosphate oxidase